MFAVNATHADPDNPLAALKIGDGCRVHLLQGYFAGSEMAMVNARRRPRFPLVA